MAVGRACLRRHPHLPVRDPQAAGLWPPMIAHFTAIPILTIGLVIARVPSCA
jgi:hypothetical protein